MGDFRRGAAAVLPVDSQEERFALGGRKLQRFRNQPKGIWIGNVSWRLGF
jgi:hypothetical protein